MENTLVTVDVAGGPIGGAARFRKEFYQYLGRTGDAGIKVIGSHQRVTPAWLLRREILGSVKGRRVALNNVGFILPGGEHWTLLGNALHFLNNSEVAELDPSLHAIATRQAAVVRFAARRSDVLIAPCSAMAERVSTILPDVQKRLVVRMHPVSANPIKHRHSEALVLCPIIFEAYKHMEDRLYEWISAVEEGGIDPELRLLVTATASELPASIAHSNRIELVGRMDHVKLCRLWARSRAIYFPPGLESFGFPLAEARANGQPVIARDAAQSREIAGPALCGFQVGDRESLQNAIRLALTMKVYPDPEPFDPDAYFNWMLGKAT